VLQPGTQLSGNTQVVSLEEPIPCQEHDNEVFSLGDMLSNDREDPGTVGARNLDWAAFCSDQPERNRAILKHAAAGEPLTEVANRYGISRSSIQTNKNRLAEEIREFMGEDILQECTQLPAWKCQLMAGRERVACRWERQAA
jgi:DNA-directed RNA polymerase specialized sigma subunit